MKTAYTIILTAFCLTASAQYRKYSFQQPKMGSPCNIILYSTDSLKAEQAALHAFRMIDSLNLVYSDYLPESELNRLCMEAGTGRWIKVSETLFSILKKAYKAGQASQGSFDITMSPVIRLWRTARREKRLPASDSITAAKRRTGYKYIGFHNLSHSIRLLKPGMQLDLGGIAKGETAQKAVDRLRENGFPYALVDAGGDIVVGIVPPGITGWHIAINLPETEDLMNRQLLLQNKAVTTSGDLYQYLELNGVRYSHIIDPATGWAVTSSRNVTVIADTGADADWLTKACSILPIGKAMELIKKYPGAEVQIGVLRQGRLHFYRSAGFAAFF